MAATLLAVNERAHVDLSDDDIGAEPAMLGATDCSFFTGPQASIFTVATSIVGSRTFPSWLRAMRRVDLMDDPRFSSAAARRLNFGALHQIIQSWMLTFPDMATLDAQFDEAKIAMGEIRSIKELTRVGVERLLGRGPAGPRSQRRRIPASRPPLALFRRGADADRHAGVSGRAQPRGVSRTRRLRGGAEAVSQFGRSRCSPTSGCYGEYDQVRPSRVRHSVPMMYSA